MCKGPEAGSKCTEKLKDQCAEVQQERLARLGLDSVFIFRAVASFRAGPGTVGLGLFFDFVFLILLAVVWNLV